MVLPVDVKSVVYYLKKLTLTKQEKSYNDFSCFL